MLVFGQKLDFVRTLYTTSALLILLFGFEVWYFKYPAQVIICAAFIAPRLLTMSQTWFTLACLATGTILAHWEPTDNHKYLLCYWLWTLFLAAEFRTPAVSRLLIANNARFYLVLTMLGAALQKGLSQTYIDSSFFEVTMLTDKRFAFLATSFGMSPDRLKEVWWQYQIIQSPFIDITNRSFVLNVDWQMKQLAGWVTIWDISIQIVIGLCFALCRQVYDLMGHLLLVFFIFTTYIVAPVFGFGLTLCIFGLATTRVRNVFIRTAYLSLIGIIILYQIPFRDLFPS